MVDWVSDESEAPEPAKKDTPMVIDMDCAWSFLAKYTDAQRQWIEEYTGVEETYWFKGEQVSNWKFMVTPKGMMPSGLVGLAVAAAREEGMTIEVNDLRKKPCGSDLNVDLEWLRPDQLAAVTQMAKTGRGLIEAPTGEGKTEVFIGLSRLLSCEWLYVVHRVDLVGQTAERILLRTGDTAGTFLGGVWKRGTGNITVATFQSIRAAAKKRRPNYLQFREAIQGMFVDEVHCFPRGTLVGGKPIEQIRVGDVVPSYDERTKRLCAGRVLKVMQRKTKDLLRLHFSDGTTLCCDSAQPFFTGEHWAPAYSLCGQSVLYLQHEQKASTSVDRVEVLELGVDGEFGGLCSGGDVFNLEVEDTHTYLVEGFVTHNCQPADSFYRGTMSFNNAYYRFGGSATPLERGDWATLRTVGALGPVAHKVTVKTLADMGLLAMPRVRMVKHKHKFDEAWSWQEVYRNCITQNDERNELLADLVEQAAKPGLVFVEHLEHARALMPKLAVRGLLAELAHGSHWKEERKDKLGRLAEGSIDVVVCTVIFQEGIDVPELMSVVVGGGKASVVAALQKVGRGMRRMPNKTEFEVWDVFDRSQKWLRSHSKQRQAAYESRGYDVQVEDR